MYLQRWHGWCHKKLLPSRRVLCTPYNHAPCHFMQSHIRKVYACLAVTCHLRFWQNDRGLLRATAVTRGWNGYRNKSQHRKLILEKKILPPLQQGFEPPTFRSRVRRSNHWAIPVKTMQSFIFLHISIYIKDVYRYIKDLYRFYMVSSFILRRLTRKKFIPRRLTRKETCRLRFIQICQIRWRHQTGIAGQSGQVQSLSSVPRASKIAKERSQTI